MRNTITYRHWQPGDDDAVLKLLVPAEQCNEDYYRKKFNSSSLAPEGIRLAIVGQRVVGHVLGSRTSLFVEGRIQDFGLVTFVFVAPDMRRQGIATRLMQELHAHFQKAGYRGSILDVDTKEAIQLYQKVGYQKFTQELQTQLLPNSDVSQLKWTEVNLKDLSAFPQLDERWAKHNFPVVWEPQGMKVHQYTMSGYRVLRHGQKIVGYSRWEKPSEYYPHGLIKDPIVPEMDSMEVIAAVQAAIPAPRAWQTCEGSRYEDPLLSLGCTLELTQRVDMLLSFGPEIDWTGLARTFI
ncbi:MAG: GNAT family N-acetyltransferase [Candidatus Poribacteria bacterium]|nr:GNAT family N-acetyltransferase [Candidatus Poribacteria bacterium]